MSIADNWRALEADVAHYARGPVTIVAVTKQRPLEDVRAVLAAGARVLGENRVEEAHTKYAAWHPRTDVPDARIHMIGHLQSHKAREAAGFFDCVQSIDSVRLAQKLHTHCQAAQQVMDVFIEVNISGEAQKFGVRLAEAHEVVAACTNLPALRLRGLMTLAPYTHDEDVLRTVFRSLRALRDELQAAGAPDTFTELSMGMSNDYHIALQEGSTMIRIGTALFGASSQGH